MFIKSNQVQQKKFFTLLSCLCISTYAVEAEDRELPRSEMNWKALNKAASSTVTKGLQQTLLAVIGEISIGQNSYTVCHQKLVIKGMPSPRGQSNLLLIDSKGKLAAEYSIISGVPLWCEGARIYCFGTEMLLQGIAVDPKIDEMYPNSANGGNVIDFAKGVKEPVITREKKYGSSGGILDDPWKK